MSVIPRREKKTVNFLNRTIISNILKFVKSTDCVRNIAMRLKSIGKWVLFECPSREVRDLDDFVCVDSLRISTRIILTKCCRSKKHTQELRRTQYRLRSKHWFQFTWQSFCFWAMCYKNWHPLLCSVRLYMNVINVIPRSNKIRQSSKCVKAAPIVSLCGEL